MPRFHDLNLSPCPNGNLYVSLKFLNRSVQFCVLMQHRMCNVAEWPAKPCLIAANPTLIRADLADNTAFRGLDALT